MAPITRSTLSSTPSSNAIGKNTPKVIKKRPRTTKKKPETEKDENLVKLKFESVTGEEKKTEKKLQKEKKLEDGKTKNKPESDKDENPVVNVEEKKLLKKKTSEDRIPAKPQKLDAKSIYEFSVKDIDGNEVSLDKYKGHVCIIVNVASRCGHTTSNYHQFIQLYEKYAESKGLRILAFPCNQFGSQEPGTCEKIKAFAEKKGVKFDLFDKINVNGPKAESLWVYLKETLPEVTSGKATGKDIKWNFTKFIIDKTGIPVERYPSSTKPNTLEDTLESLF